MRMECDHFRHTFELTGAQSEFPSVVGIYGFGSKHISVILIQNTMWAVGLNASILSKIIVILRANNSETKAPHYTDIRTCFWFIDRGSKSKIRVAILTHQKLFPDGYNCGLRCTCIMVSHQIRMCLLARILSCEDQFAFGLNATIAICFCFNFIAERLRLDLTRQVHKIQGRLVWWCKKCSSFVLNLSCMRQTTWKRRFETMWAKMK